MNDSALKAGMTTVTRGEDDKAVSGVDGSSMAGNPANGTAMARAA
jgi:hypothetical protein